MYFCQNQKAKAAKNIFASSPQLLLLFIITLIGGAVNAQQTTVTYKIVNNKKEAVPYATVTVLPVPDSTNFLQKTSDSTGSATFTLVQNRPYLVRVSSVDYNTLEKAITVKGDNPTYILTVEPSVNTLGNVVVTSSRPVMRQEDDKTIVDPENLAASSTNAHEILEKTPGLFVDQDGNIYLSSTTPATVHINGREQKMSASDIATMLKSLPPNSIASIEILRTPSARYDASGGGGIVNVVLKKGVRIGLTGSVNTGFNQGKYGNRFIGFTLNNNSGLLSSYINVQYSYRKNYEEIKTDRNFAPDSLLSQFAVTTYPTNSYYVGYGLSYAFTRNWELSYDGRLSHNRSENSSINESIIKKISTGQIITNNFFNVDNQGRSYNINQGIASKLKLDSAGSEWTVDASYTYAPNNNTQLFSTTYNQPVSFNRSGEGDIENKLHFFSASTNFLKKLPKQFTVETGIKTTNVIFNNGTNYFNNVNGDRVKDAIRTRAYKYNENINAAYVQASKSISGIVLKAGTRVENTNMKGVQETPYDTSFTLHRTDFFPYIYLSRTVMKIAGYDLRAYLVYRRTINRPAYEYLNPSVRFVDQYLYETGNPSLRPQFTKNYEANISVDERPLLAIGYNDTKDIFTQVVYQADTSSKSLAYRTYDNLGNNKETYFRVLGAIPPGKRYFFVLGAQYNHNHYQGLYEGKPLEYKRGSWSIFTYQTFKLTPLTQLSINGFARFNGQQQFYELSKFGMLNFSVNQQLLNKKLVIGASINDIFFTNNNEFTLNQGTVNASGYRKGDTRRFGLNVRYNFGIRKKEENNIFNMESPEKSN